MERGSLLIVDDNEASRSMLARRLERKGYKVSVAEGGRRALEVVGQQAFDLVLLDIIMPDLSGMEVLEVLRRSWSNAELPVIMVTAKDESEDIVSGLRLGANDYVTKPLDFPVVLARVQTQLSLKHAVDQNRRLEQDLEQRNREVEAANNQLAQAIHELTAIFENAAVGIIHTRDGVIQRCNRRAVDMFGFASTQEMTGQTRRSLHPDAASYERVQRDAEPLLSAGLSFSTDQPLRKVDGSPLWCRMYGRAVDPVHTSQGTVWIMEDITEAKRIEDELMDAKERAEVASRAKSVFLANMSHELRTPLNAILGYAQILKLDRQAGGRQLAALSTIEHGVQHLLSMIDDVLDLARIEASECKLHPEPVELSAFVQSIVSIMRVRAEQRGLGLVVESPDRDWRVLVDVKRLRQVLLNLLGNAVKFTDAGQVALRVSASPEGDDQVRVRFAVEDSGIGIAEEDLRKLFQPFQQLGNLERRRGGTGLGLAISRQLVQLMGGEDIEVHSELEHGSRFSFKLPLDIAPPAPAESAVEATLVAGYRGSRKSVLVIDDTPESRSMLVDLLGPLGFSVHEASNGQQGLQCAAAVRPDAILIDCIMPVMDGLDATRRLRQSGFEHSTIIAISASASRSDEERALAAGASAFLPKPLRLDALFTLLEQHLGIQFIYETRSARASEAVGAAGNHSKA